MSESKWIRDVRDAVEKKQWRWIIEKLNTDNKFDVRYELKRAEWARPSPMHQIMLQGAEGDEGAIETFRKMFELGANPNCFYQKTQGQEIIFRHTLLHTGVLEKQKTLVLQLVKEHDADMTIPGYDKTYGEGTPLDWAQKMGNNDDISKIISVYWHERTRREGMKTGFEVVRSLSVFQKILGK